MAEKFNEKGAIGKFVVTDAKKAEIAAARLAVKKSKGRDKK
jgi:hypothetical protein